MISRPLMLILSSWSSNASFLIFSGKMLKRFNWHALLFVSMLFSVMFSKAITSLGKMRAGLCASRAFVYLFCTRQFLSFFSSTWCQGLTAASDCGTPWTFVLTFLVRAGTLVR